MDRKCRWHHGHSQDPRNDTLNAYLRAHIEGAAQHALNTIMAEVLEVTTAGNPSKGAEGTSEETSKNATLLDSISDSVVAKHYNERQEVGLQERTKSRIFFLRNFNNWIKSICIADVLQRLRTRDPRAELTVLDLCCGKGGDLLKWKKGQISRLVCSDIAEMSLQQCEERYKELGNRSHNPHEKVTFRAEFYKADLSKEVLSEMYEDPSIQFHLTSCQFSFHYSFESQAQAETMLRNACERLRPGGYFIGTVPNGCELVRRLRASEGTWFGNDFYSVNFHSKDKFPLFGCQYDFHLDGVVDCPEFLLYFPLLEEMAKRHQMELVYCKTFHEFFQEHSGDPENSQLLSRMKSLEQYPPDRGNTPSSSTDGDYSHAEEHFQRLKEQSDRHIKLGTLSKSEWEATSLYVVFAFRKETSQESATAMTSTT
ncbi:mRNA cap guanine-N7 methyltransferase-like [Acanthaster planci]|uniref:mRNA cap guanine-N(7) methyltransferase n=1 Tax=Acanthaster planci TaxID=133434 RepID=A0A8B7YMP4_ACAPL|nr:mRNA cap guanine-N7 methyltransferase-like [Acanthaster planci]